MIISKEAAELLKDNEDNVHINGFGKIHILNFPIETEDYIKESKPKLTNRDQHSLVVLSEVRHKLVGIIASQDNRKLSSKVCEIHNLTITTLEKFKD